MTRVTYACLMPSIRYGIPSFSVFSGLSWGAGVAGRGKHLQLVSRHLPGMEEALLLRRPSAWPRMEDKVHLV